MRKPKKKITYRVGDESYDAELGTKIYSAEVVPRRFHVDCHIESARKARRHDLWRLTSAP